MTTFYLPIETSKRELISKIFLATRLAAQGHDVVVFYYKMFDQTRWPSGGIYLGKNCFRTEVPYSLKYYRKMKRAGLRLWYLDEEAGIYSGNDIEEWQRILLQRLTPSDLDAEDRIFTWGHWQAATFRKAGSDAEIHVTGSPNYDLLQPKYNHMLGRFDSEQTGGMKNFVLINTRFAFSNGLFSLNDHLHYAKTEEQKRFVTGYAAIEGVMKYLFVQLVLRLAETFPEETFVLRPHPAENPAFYKQHFQFMPNVQVIKKGDVGSWIRRCRILIQNGCSTSIQAKINDKPVITYLPYGIEDNYSAALPNRLGAIATRPEEVIAFLHEEQDIQRDIWHDTISELDAIAMIANFSREEPISKEGRMRLAKRIRRYSLRFERLELLKRLVLPFMPTKRRNFRIYADKFDAPLFSEAPKVHTAANQYYNAHTRLKRFGRYCYHLTP